MAETNLVSKPPLQVRIIEDNGLMSRAWSTWFRDIYNRVAYKGGNAIDENVSNLNATNSTLSETITVVNQNTTDNENNKASIDGHIALESAHGSNGNIVGFDDLADETIVGLVKRMQAIVNVTDSIVNVTAPDVGAAPAVYDQAYAQSSADLSNANKAAINLLVLDLNVTITALNELLDQSKASGQMTL